MAVDPMIATLEREQKGLEQERDDLRATGDLLQSSLSRVLAWIDANADRIPALGYEVDMARLEGESRDRAVDRCSEEGVNPRALPRKDATHE